jgi:hypothetical protein
MLNIKQCCGLGRCVVTKDLLDCKSCNGISYCGKEHQQEHFKAGHKLVSLIGDKYKIIQISVPRFFIFYSQFTIISSIQRCAKGETNRLHLIVALKKQQNITMNKCGLLLCHIIQQYW